MKRFATFFAAALIAVPVFSSALTNDEIRAQLTALLAQLQAVQAQLKNANATTTIYSTTATSTPAQSGEKLYCPGLRRALAFGARGEDVKELQRFLVSKGLLAADSATGYFGALTREAVRAWQAAEGIASNGDENSTGWGSVGAKSRSAIARMCGLMSDMGAQGALSGGTSTSKPEAECVIPKFVSGSIPGGSTNAQWALPLMTRTAGEKGFSLTVTGLPAGVTLKESTSTIDSITMRNWSLTGTPAKSGEYVIVATARNDCSKATRTINLSISAGGGSNSSTSGGGVSCATYAAPSCPGGTLEWLGNNGNGCSLGYKCTQTTQGGGVSCPVYQQPICAANYSLKDGGYYDNGCAAPATCVPNTTTSNVQMSFTNPVAGGTPFSRYAGESITFGWDASNVPVDSAVVLYLMKLGGDGVFSNAGAIGVGLPVGSMYTWTVPQSTGSTCADCATVQSVEAGAYKVQGKIYTPANAWITGYPPANPVSPTFIATAESGQFTLYVWGEDSGAGAPQVY